MTYDPMYLARQAEATNARTEALIEMTRADLEPAAESAWPEEEAAEFESLRAGGVAIPEVASESEARTWLDEVVLKLPKQPTPWWLDGSPSAELDAWVKQRQSQGQVVMPLMLPVSYASPHDEVVLHRLDMHLWLSASGGEPIVLHMRPTSSVIVDEVRLGEVGVDLGKVSELVPHFPPVLKAEVSAPLERQRVRTKLQSWGVGQSECAWLVSSPELAYGFAPLALVEVPLGTTVSVVAGLRVDLRRQVLKGLWRRTYGKLAEPRRYIIDPQTHTTISSVKYVSVVDNEPGPAPSRRPAPSGPQDESIRNFMERQKQGSRRWNLFFWRRG